MSTEDFKAKALRIAASIVNEYPHDSYDENVQMVAYAYERGLADGHVLGLELAAKTAGTVRS